LDHLDLRLLAVLLAGLSLGDGDTIRVLQGMQ
jgi:hypothetical protein